LVEVPVNATSTSITDYKDGEVRFRTLYVPVIDDVECIDVFYTAYTPITFEVLE